MNFPFNAYRLEEFPSSKPDGDNSSFKEYYTKHNIRYAHFIFYTFSVILFVIYPSVSLGYLLLAILVGVLVIVGTACEQHASSHHCNKNLLHFFS